MRLATLAFAALLLGAAPSLADTLVNGRYVAKSGDFSVDMHRPQDQAFHLSKEASDANTFTADFLFAPGSTFWGLTASRTVEWLKLQQPIPPEQNDMPVQSVVDGYLSGRYPSAKFEMTARRKARTAEGQLYYVLEAKATLSNTAVTWRGVVLIFDHGIALVAQIANTDARKWGIENWFDEPVFVQWAISVRP